MSASSVATPRCSARTGAARSASLPSPEHRSSGLEDFRSMRALPSGTVTFLFTDIEGSTRLWEEHPEVMKGALARHDAISRDAVDTNHGALVKTTGDGLHAAFPTAHD